MSRVHRAALIACGILFFAALFGIANAHAADTPAGPVAFAARCPPSHQDGIEMRTGTTEVKCWTRFGGSYVRANLYLADQVSGNPYSLLISANINCPVAWYLVGVYATVSGTLGYCVQTGGSFIQYPASFSITYPDDVLKLQQVIAELVAFLASFGVGFWYASKPKGGVLD